MRPLITQKMIDKAKKKLKKLQKRQREQDKQGVFSFDAYFAESNELIKKLGDVWAAGIKDIYGKQYRVSADQWSDEQIAKAKESNEKPYEINKINPLIDDIINAPVITERLDVSERPIACDEGMKPRIINTMTIEDFIKWRDKMTR
jgi:hypothetical protein